VNPLIVTMLQSVLRMALLGLFASLIEKGIVSQDQVTELSGLLVGVLGFGVTAAWALLNHYRARVKFKTALALPAGTSEAAVDAKIKRGLGASL
jgi:hypothetical protein